MRINTSIGAQMNDVIREREKFYLKFNTSDWRKIEPLLTPVEKQRWDLLDRELNELMVESLKRQGI